MKVRKKTPVATPMDVNQLFVSGIISRGEAKHWLKALKIGFVSDEELVRYVPPEREAAA